MNETEQEIAYNETIEEAIMNRRTIAAVDASIDERFMAAIWVFITLEERVKHVNGITSTKQIKGATLAAKGISILKLVKEINNKTKHLTGEKIKTYSDDKQVINSVLTELTGKANAHKKQAQQQKR